MIVNLLMLIIFIIELQPFAENYISPKERIQESARLDQCSVKKQRRGSQPSKTFKAGGKIIRDLVIQLKGAKYLENFGGEEELNHGLTLT